MKNVIVTGATSFIGSHIINELIEHDCKVTAVVRPDSKKLAMLPVSKNIEIIYLDVNNIGSLPNKISKNKFDVFYHLAWEGVRAPYRDDHFLQEKNYKNTVKSMEVAIQLKCNKFIGSGSQSEYGICIGKIDENYKTLPITEYGKAKLKSYQELLRMAQEQKIEFIWTRIFSVYGKYDYEGTLIMSSIGKMLRNESIDLTLCNQNWDYIYIKDVAKAIYLLGEKKCDEGIYNIASGFSQPLKKFVLEIKKIIKSTSKLNFGAIPYSKEGNVGFEPAIEKLKRNLDWKCQTDFYHGILEVIEYVKSKDKI